MLAGLEDVPYQRGRPVAGILNVTGQGHTFPGAANMAGRP